MSTLKFSKKYIVLEGIDGSGKDTQLARLQEAFRDRDDIVFTREAGGTEIGKEIRSLAIDPKYQGVMDPQTELLLFSADRAQHINEIVKSSLFRDGKHVISNRSFFATMAYQIYGREREDLLPFFEDITQTIIGDVTPSLCILFDVPVRIGLARKHKQVGKDGLDRFEREDVEYHERVRQGFLKHVMQFKGVYAIINGSKDEETVWDEVWSTVNAHLES